MVDVFLSDIDIQKLSLKEKFIIKAYTCKLILESLLLKPRKKRTYDIINTDYNSGLWNRDIEKIDFETHFFNNDSNDMIIFSYNGKFFKAISSRLNIKYNSMLLQFLADYKKDPVVELGCGLGVNQFLLYNAGFTRLEGYDISENAISRDKQHSKKKGCPYILVYMT